MFNCLTLLLSLSLLLPAIQDQEKPAPPLLTEHGTYRLGAGDILDIQISGEADLSGNYEIQNSGNIRFPILGDVYVQGLTPEAAAKKIEKLLEQDYFVDIQLNLRVEEYRSQWVNVLGEIKKPGKYYLRTASTLMDIISEAGGLTAQVADKILVQREINEGGVRVQKIYPIDVEELTSGLNPEANILILSGDTIKVKQRDVFYVRGEVNRPGEYQLSDEMTIMEAIAVAGDFAKYADRNNIKIQRKKKDGTLEIIPVSLNNIVKNKEDNVKLQPGDVVVIQRRFL